MESQGEPSSSNSVNQKLGISEEVKEGEPETKKVKQDESENIKESQDETTGTSINDLPTEMLMKILKHVNDERLMACRLLSRAWRDISTEILCARGKMELQFVFDETNRIFKQMIKKNMGKRTLSYFLECFKESKNCFYTRFLFRFNLRPSPSKFENEDWLEFLSYIKDSVKCLKLVIEPYGSTSIQRLSEDLSDLLLTKLPRLEEFGLSFSSTQTFRSQVQLFSSEKVSESTTTTTNTTATETETIETTIITKTIRTLPSVQLPHLKVLHLSEVLFLPCPKIVDDLLEAAVNLKCIKDFGEYHSYPKKFKAKEYVVLHSHGKLDLLEEAQMTPSVELFTACNSIVHSFKLKKLELCMSSIYGEEENWEDASTFISHLFESSKDTLKDLTMDPVGFLPGVKLPRFTKLKVLTIKDTKKSKMLEPVFPFGINSLDVFPVLLTLELNVLDWTKSFPELENVPRIPTVEFLHVSDWKITGNCILKISLLCPNLKAFAITSTSDADYNVNFPEVGRAIWTHMKQLEFLYVTINVDSEFNTFHSLDSCFTGFSVENCKRVYELMRAEEDLKRWNSQANIPKAEFDTPERESASILDLKGLKNLSIQLQWHVGDRISADNLLERALTNVSEVYAFKLMENLKYEIDHDVDY